MIQEKMNVLEQVGLSESNLSDNAVNASFHLKVNCVNRWNVFTRGYPVQQSLAR